MSLRTMEEYLELKTMSTCSSLNDAIVPSVSTIGRRMTEVGDSFADEDYSGISFDDGNPEPRKKMRISSGHEERLGAAAELICQQNPDYNGALQIYEEVVDVSSDPYVHNYMAMCHKESGRIEEALRCLKKSVGSGRGGVEALEEYTEISMELGKENEMLEGLKRMIESRNVSSGQKLHLLRTIVDKLEERQDSALLRFQLKLLPMEVAVGSNSALKLAMKIGTTYLNSGRAALAVKRLSILDLMMEQTGIDEQLLRAAVSVYVEAFLECEKPENALLMLRNHGIVRTSPVNVVFERAEKVSISENWSEEPGFMANVCVAVLTSSGQNFAAVEYMITTHLFEVEEFRESKQILRLVHTLLKLDHGLLARDLLLHLQEPRRDSHLFRTKNAYDLLGNINESLSDIEAAKVSYERSMEAARTYHRYAHHRVCALQMEFPALLNPGDIVAVNRERNLKLQWNLHQKYLEMTDSGEKAELVDVVVRFVLAPFSQPDPIEADRFLWALKTPLAMDIGLKRYKVSAAILSNGLSLQNYWQIVWNGCMEAFRQKRFNEMVNVAFHVMRTTEFRRHSEMIRKMKWMVVLAAYYMPPNSAEDLFTRKPVNKRLFCYDYLREDLCRKRTADEFTIRLWNFFFLLATDPLVIKAPIMVKFAKHWLVKNGYDMHIQMILANDSMRRGSYPHAYKLYYEILENERQKKLPWGFWLNFAIVTVNLACRFRVANTERCRLYSLAMFYMAKYAKLRGTCPEVLYNKARACHQFQDYGQAIYFYEKCLDLSRKTIPDDMTRDEERQSDFTFAAAVNLRMLYTAQERPDMVRVMDRSILDWKEVKLMLSI